MLRWNLILTRSNRYPGNNVAWQPRDETGPSNFMTSPSPSLPWIEPPPLTIPPEFQIAVGGHPLLAETLLRRGIYDPGSGKGLPAVQAFLNPDLYTPNPAADLPGMEETTSRLQRAILIGERIGVWGDFDVDGQTATTLLVETLQGLGADVIYHIPVRARESHGINLPNLKELRQNGAQLVLTCDTGIAALEAAEYARSEGFDLLVTDHHTLPQDLPPAHSLVNPHFLPPDHPLASLCGVGVAYKLAEILNQQAGRSEHTPELLDLAALGTIADVAQLTGDNRWIVQKGLVSLRDPQRPALRAMLRLAEVNAAQLNEQHLSYILAPRLNALGRLGDANPVVEFLRQRIPEAVGEMATALERLNRERQLLVKHVFEGAQAQIKQNPGLLDDPLLVLQAADWPGGVIGIVASRLTELYQRPSLLITSPPGELARGSARSVDGVDITAALGQQSALLHGFGGHSMAAGFSLPAENIPLLRRALSKAALAGVEIAPRALEISATLPLSAITLELVEALDKLSPFGPGNPPLVLASSGLTIRNISQLGRTNEHLQVMVEDPAGTQRRITWWQGACSPQPESPFDLAYTVHASSYRGQRELQIEWRTWRSRPDTSLHAPQLTSRRVETHDWRAELQAEKTLTRLAEPGGLVIWAEGEDRPAAPSADRLHLAPAAILAIWNAPAGPEELAAVLEAVRPQVVHLFAQPGGSLQLPAFLACLGGLVRYAIRSRQGQVSLAELAAACATREAAARLGVDWLAAKGYIRLDAELNGLLELSLPNTPSPDPHAADRAEKALKRILDETAAYQRYYLTAPMDSLL
jgi:single-stranded-DNA-specific exonuclease